MAVGFEPARWIELAQALKQHVIDHEAAAMQQTTFGTRYRVEGTIQTPSGRTPMVRSVWFLTDGDNVPRLATAYPMRVKRG